MSVKCLNENCVRPATCAPKLCVPAEGVPIDTHKPLSSLINLPLCDECFGQLNAAEFITDQIREIFQWAARASVPMDRRGTYEPVPPDFARAFFTRVALGSEEFKIMEKAAHGRSADKADH